MTTWSSPSRTSNGRSRLTVRAKAGQALCKRPLARLQPHISPPRRFRYASLCAPASRRSHARPGGLRHRGGRTRGRERGAAHRGAAHRRPAGGGTAQGGRGHARRCGHVDEEPRRQHRMGALLREGGGERGTGIALDGRESKIIVANYDLGGNQLRYSTSELMTNATIGGQDVAVLYGGA